MADGAPSPTTPSVPRTGLFGTAQTPLEAVGWCGARGCPQWCTFQNGPYKPLDTTGSPIHVEPVPGPGLEPQTQVGVVAALTNAYGLATAAIKLVTRTHPGGVRSVRLTLPGAEWVMSGGEGPERIYHRGAQEVARSEDYHLDIDPSADPMDSVAVVWLHAVRESGGW